MTIRKKLVGLCTMTVFALLLASCAIYKPLREVAPETFGLTCVTEEICVEDPATIDEATHVRNNALSFIAENVGPIERAPRFLFCRSKECFARIGNPAVSALYIKGLNTIIINDKGRNDYILRHELIHHWQFEQFGAVRFSTLPRWYIEGMAYSLSQDPRDPLPRSDIEEWRTQFEKWVDAGNDWRQTP